MTDMTVKGSDPSADASRANPPTEAASPGPRRLWLKIPLFGFLAFLVFELLFLAWYWVIPPWSEMREGKTPESALIKDYQNKRDDDKKLPALRWKPIVKNVPKHVSKVFLLAEDSRFYEHDGFDYEAIEAAMKYNWKKGKLLRGASTISQQTAKNMFLSLSRNPLRKWHEVLLTYMLEAKLSKQAILHTYLNVAEFGLGIYGIEAAAQAYFHTSASNLSEDQATQLAATLPSPKKHNPATQTKAFRQRDRRVSSAIRMIDRYMAQRGKKATGATSALPTDAEIAEKLREAMADPASERNDESTDETGVSADTAATGTSADPLSAGELSGEALEAAKSASKEDGEAPAHAPADPGADTESPLGTPAPADAVATPDPSFDPAVAPTPAPPAPESSSDGAPSPSPSPPSEGSISP